MVGNCKGYCFFVFSFLFALQGFAQNNQAYVVDENAYNEALQLFEKAQYGNAQYIFDKVAQTNSILDKEKSASAAYYAALCAMRLYNKDAKQRVDYFADKYELNPLSNRLFLDYGHYRFSTKRYKDASEYYEKVDKYRLEESDLNEYLFKKAYALLSIENHEDAKKIFFDLKDKESSYSNSAKYYYAHLLYVDSNYNEALVNFIPLQEDASFGPLVPYYLAHIYHSLGDYDKLLEVGEQLIEKATPSRAPEIAKLTADAFYNKARYEEAIKYLEVYKEKGGRMLLEDYFELGYSYYKTKQYHMAIASFNKITNGKDDMLQNAYYHLGDCYVKVDEKRKAITAFKAASEIEALPSIKEDAAFNYAKLVYELSDPYNDAITVLNAFLDDYPQSTYITQVNRYLANLYVTTKDYDKALLAIQRTGLQAPEMQEIYQKVAFYRASEIFNALQYKMAIQKYKEVLKYPVNKSFTALSVYWIAEAQYRLGMYDKALEGFDNFRTSTGAINMEEHTISLYQTAYCYYKKSDFQQAANFYRQFTSGALKGDERIPDAYMRLADSYLLTGGYLLAIEFYQAAIKNQTKEADYALFQMAECLSLAGKREDKIGKLQELIKKYPASVYAENAAFEIAFTQLQLENYDKAIQSFKAYISRYPKGNQVAAAKMQIGLAYSNTDQNAKALESFKLVINEYPGTEESMEAVGLARLIYARENRINEYLDWVETLAFVDFEKSTLDSTAYNAAFDVYAAGDCEESITALSQYVNRFEKGLFALKAHYYLAGCAQRTHELALAKKSYAAILSFPENEYTAEASEKMAYFAYEAEDYELAKQYFAQWAALVQQKTKLIAANTGIMRSVYNLMDYKEAIVYAAMVLSMDPNDAALILEARSIAATSHYTLDNYDKAYEYYEAIAQNSSGEAKANAMYYMADIQFRNGKYEASTATINTLIEDLPSYKEIKLKALLLLAKNSWKQEDDFQANYILDFIIEGDNKAEITEEAEALKAQILIEQQKAEAEKQALIKEKNKPIILDESAGLMIIDEPEEMEEPLDSIF